MARWPCASRLRREVSVRRHPPPGALRHEGVEEPLLLGIIGRRVLRMPLHPDHPTIGQLHGLDGPVFGRGRNDGARRPVDRWPGDDAVPDRPAEPERGEAAGRPIVTGWTHEAMVVDVLAQRAAVGDVEDLRPPADRQHGEVEAEGDLEGGDLESVLARVDALTVGSRPRRRRSRWIDVAAAQHQQAVEPRQHGHESITVVGGTDDDRLAAGPAHAVEVPLARRHRLRAYPLCLGRAPTGDGDEGQHASTLLLRFGDGTGEVVHRFGPGHRQERAGRVSAPCSRGCRRPR